MPDHGMHVLEAIAMLAEDTAKVILTALRNTHPPGGGNCHICSYGSAIFCGAFFRTENKFLGYHFW